MEPQNQTEVQTETAVEVAKKETKAEKASLDYPVIKVQLPKEAALRVQSAIQTLKERKADTKADELIAEFLNGITEEYLDSQIEKRTPEDYYFEAARSMPELREKIIVQAKKALQKTDKSASPVFASEAKKPKKKEKADEFQGTVDGPEISQ